MSLDWYLEAPTVCPHCGEVLKLGGNRELYWRNITHNVTPMWRKAGVYDALYMSDGHKALEYIEALEKGVQDMRANFVEYKKLDSPNGWGLAIHALPFLEEALAAAKENPDAVIRVSK